jgi:hypothetical protein
MVGDYYEFLKTLRTYFTCTCSRILVLAKSFKTIWYRKVPGPESHALLLTYSIWGRRGSETHYSCAGQHFKQTSDAEGITLCSRVHALTVSVWRVVPFLP